MEERRANICKNESVCQYSQPVAHSIIPPAECSLCKHKHHRAGLDEHASSYFSSSCSRKLLATFWGVAHTRAWKQYVSGLGMGFFLVSPTQNICSLKAVSSSQRCRWQCTEGQDVMASQFLRGDVVHRLYTRGFHKGFK